MSEPTEIESAWLVGGGIMVAMPEGEAQALAAWLEEKDCSMRGSADSTHVGDRLLRALRRWV